MRSIRIMRAGVRGCQATKGRSACVGRANSCTLTIMNGALSDLVKNTLLVVGVLFPIVNPVGNTPIFLSLTRGLSGRGRTALARMIALNGLALILTSIFIGTHILAFFGISLPVVQVGGGLIVISTGWALLLRAFASLFRRPSCITCAAIAIRLSSTSTRRP